VMMNGLILGKTVLRWRLAEGLYLVHADTSIYVNVFMPTST
jgi:hypothetical protein